MLLANNDLLEDTSSNSVLANASTLGLFLWDVLARARGKENARFKAVQGRPFLWEGPRPRIPVSEVPMSYSRQRLKKSKLNYDVKNKTIPQRLAEETMPRVHDRLPDPDLWRQIDKKLRTQETENYLKSASEKLKLFRTEAKRTLKTVPSDVEIQKETDLAKESKTTQLTDNIKESGLFLKRRKRSLSDHPELEGVLRRRQLYCRTGYHIQIQPNGRVTGTDKDHDRYGEDYFTQYVWSNTCMMTVISIKQRVLRTKHYLANVSLRIAIVTRALETI